MGAAAAEIAVFVESGKRRVFASALDWPGWARSAKTEHGAIAALDDYLPRYAAITSRAGLQPPAGCLVVAERHQGLAKGADFGALGEIADCEAGALDPASGARLALLLQAAWAAFEETADAAPAQLRKGPRGGGRDTAQIITHVRDSEVLYARKLGLRGAGATTELRGLIVAGLQHPDGLVIPPNGWPARYAARRMAWHVLDHLWEIEDKSEPAA